MEKSQREKLQRFSIRKLSIGAVSCLIGTVTFLGYSHDVQAAEKPQTVETTKAENAIQSEKAQESKPTEEAKSDTQNVAVNKNAVESQKAVDNNVGGSQQADALTAVNQANSKDKTPLTDSAEKESKAAITTPVKQDTTTPAKQNSVANGKSIVPEQEHLKLQQKTSTVANQTVLRVKNKAPLTNLAENKVVNDTGVTTPAQQDGAANEKLIGTGKKASVSLSDGSTLTINNDVLDDQNNSAILTFQSGSFKAGDTYQIKVPKKGHLRLDKVDVASLQQGMGTTTFDDSDENYWVITDNFTSTGTVKQDIKINRYTDNYSTFYDLKDYVRNIYHNCIQLSKNSEEKANLNIDEIDNTYRLTVNVNDQYQYGQTLLFNNDENKIVSYNVSIMRKGSEWPSLLSDDKIDISTTIENLDWAIPDKVFVDGEESNFIYDSNNKELIVPLTYSDGQLNFNVDVIGRVNVDLGKFDSHHKLYVHNEVGVRTKINNIEANNSDTMGVTVIDSVQNLTVGDMFQINRVSDAGYYDNQYPTPIDYGEYNVNDGETNGNYNTSTQGVIANSGIINIKNVTGKKLDNVSVDADIPDGIDLTNVDFVSNVSGYKREKIDIKTIISYTDGSSDIVSTSGLKRFNDVLNPNNNKKIKHIKLELNNFNSGFQIELQSPNTSDLSSIQKENTKIAEKYADGTPVAPGDLIIFKETISAYGQKDTVDTGYLRLVDHNHDMYKLDLGLDSYQSNKSPNIQDAGNVVYTIHGIKPGDSPVVYVRVPNNATLTGDKLLFRTDPSSDNNTPINYQLLHVGDSVFMKVQLPKNTSGSARLAVPYGTIPDGQTSEDQLAYAVSGIDTDSYIHKFDDMNHVVFADFYDGHVTYGNLKISNPEISNDFNALFKREGINLKDVAYYVSGYINDGRTLVIDNPTWDVLTSEGISTISMTDSNMNPMPNMDSTQNVHGEHPDTFNIYGSIINATDQTIKGATQVINVPDNSDGKSQFNPVLNGPIHLIDAVTDKDLSGLAEITYSTQKSDLSDPESTISGVSADQVTDWSQIKSVQVHFRNNSLPSKISARAVLTLKDPHIYDDIGKTIYASNKAFTKDQQTGEFELLPTVIKSGSTNSAKLTVTGQAKVHTLIHYGDQYIELPDKLKTYAELNDVMQRSDFLNSDADLTDQDRALLPANIAIDYAHPTIKNSDETYVDGYTNGLAEFGKQAKYDFNNDSVVFNAQDMKLVTDNKDVTETIHYVYKDGPKKGQKAAEDVVNTVTFTKTGYQNPFTSETKWANNTETKEFKVVVSPTITNYTPDSKKIDAIIVKQNSDNIVKTVSYKANRGNLHVIYQDDIDHQELSHQDFLNGLIGNSANYNTNDTISNYQNQHYDLVSDETNGQSLTYQDTDKTYVVHFKHHISNVDETSKSTQTVHYVASDNSAVPSDAKHEISYSRTNQHDDVTGKITNYGTWGPIKTLPDVQTPEKKGYTPDIKEVKGAATTPGKSEDFKTTVTYTPDKQKAKVVFIDDTDHQTLKTVNKDGVTKGDSGYNTRQDIQNYENQHYALVSDTSGGSELIFDDDDLTDQYYEVHLKHIIQPINASENSSAELKTVRTRTIHYVYDDGSLVKPDDVQTVTFTRTADEDMTTHELSNFGEWTADSDYSQINVPVVHGYTPIQNVVPEQTANPDHNVVLTVTYNRNHQQIKVAYVDDTTGITLDTKTLDGYSKDDSHYSTKETIDDYESHGYKLVSDGTPKDNPTLHFDSDDFINNQDYTVHLKHTTHDNNLEHSVTRTIHYVYADGTKAKDDDSLTLKFTGKETIDNVTGKTISTVWTPESQNFSEVASPIIQGYTADQTLIGDIAVNPTSDNIVKTVTYNPNKQNIHVTFIDDTTGNTLATITKSGYTNTDSGYSTKNDIDSLIAKGYKLVSDGTPKDHPTLMFDSDDFTDDQNFMVHMEHDTKENNLSREVSRTIHYVYRDGKPAGQDKTDFIEFNGVEKIDKVDGHVISTIWTPENKEFASVTTPALQGYTPDKFSVDSVVVKPDSDNQTITVTYSPDMQYSKFNYIDDTTGNTLRQESSHGVTNSRDNYSTANLISYYKNKGYDLVSDDTANKVLTFDSDDNTDQIYNIHFTHGIVTIDPQNPGKPGEKLNPQDPSSPVYPEGSDNLTRNVAREIDYIYSDGHTAKPSVKDSITFNNTQKIDRVTGEIISSTWDGPKDFITIQTPVIAGYTPSQTSVENKGIKHDTAPIKVVVTYFADPQHMTVIYRDLTDNRILSQMNKDGVSDENGHYNTKSTIDGYVANGYVLSSDDTNGKDLIFDHNDKLDQTYYVDFTHGSHQYNPEKPDAKDKVDKTDYLADYTTTINYVDHSGKTLASNKVVQDEYKRDLTIDSVNGNIIKRGDWKLKTGYISVENPVITGYITNNKSVKPADMQKNQTINVVYNVLGKVHSVDNNGKEIAKDFAYTNDPADPTKVLITKVPSVTGYEQVTTSVDPTKDPLHDTTVVFNAPATVTVNYVDTSTGKTIHTDTVKGFATHTSDYSTKNEIDTLVKQGYVLTKDNVPANIKLTENPQNYVVTLVHGITTVKHDNPIKGGTTIPNTDQKMPNGVDTGDLNREIVRTITIVDPHTGNKVTKQTVKLFRDATVDNVTGTVTYTNWNKGAWDEFTTPVVAGYTPSQNNVPSVVVTSDTKPVNVVITYTANPQTGKISYVDEGNREVANTPLNGKTDETIAITPQIPHGWVIVDGQTIPTSVVARPDGIPTVLIKIKHGTIEVMPDKPHNPTDKMPDGDNYPDGVTNDDLNREITRTINVVDPHTGLHTTVQTAHLTRNATIDLVTKAITYGKWSSSNWDEFDVPMVKGYTPSASKVAKSLVDISTKPVAVDITYTANPQKGKISYVDEGGHEVANTPLNGKTDEDVKVVPSLPHGWVLDGMQTIPDTVKATADGIPTVTIKVKHGTLQVTPDKPHKDTDKMPDGDNYPKGVSDTDLNRNFTRQIILHEPNGDKTVSQVAKYTRIATIDLVTGKVTYTDWSTKHGWDEYVPETINGYEPSIKKLDAIAKPNKDVKVEINYTAISNSNGDWNSTPVTPNNDKPVQPTEPEQNKPSEKPASKKIQKSNKKKTRKTGKKINKQVDQKRARNVKRNSFLRNIANNGAANENSGNTTQNSNFNRKTSDNSSIKMNTSSAVVNTPNSKANNATHNGNQLPQTGNENDQTIALAGILLASMGIATAIGVSRKKKHE